MNSLHPAITLIASTVAGFALFQVFAGARPAIARSDLVPASRAAERPGARWMPFVEGNGSTEVRPGGDHVRSRQGPALFAWRFESTPFGPRLVSGSETARFIVARRAEGIVVRDLRSDVARLYAEPCHAVGVRSADGSAVPGAVTVVDGWPLGPTAVVGVPARSGSVQAFGFVPARPAPDGVVLRRAAMVSGRLVSFHPGDGRLMLAQDGGGVAVEVTPEPDGRFTAGPLPLGIVWLSWSAPRCFVARDQVRQRIRNSPTCDLGAIRLRALGQIAFRLPSGAGTRVLVRVYWSGQPALGALEWPLLRGTTSTDGIVRFAGVHFDPPPRAQLWLDSGELMLLPQLDVQAEPDGAPMAIAPAAPGDIRVRGVGFESRDVLRVVTVPAGLPFARAVAVALDERADPVELRVRHATLHNGRVAVLRRVWSEPVFVVVVSAQGLVLNRRRVQVAPGSVSGVTLRAADYGFAELRNERSTALRVAITSEWGCAFVDVPGRGRLPLRVGARVESRVVAEGVQRVLRPGDSVSLGG